MVEQHNIQYEILNTHSTNTETGRLWNIEVHATPEELIKFDQTGILVRKKLFQGQALSRLQSALDQLEEREGQGKDRALSSKDGWGFIPRHLMDKDQAFLDLLKFQPLLSIARAMMGPLVRLRGLSARITYPGEDRHQQAPWHRHLRVISKPLPVWFSHPHCIDCLIYLDDLNNDTGQVIVVPESHKWLDREPPNVSDEWVEGQIELGIQAGGVVLIHGNLWHRTQPTLRSKRRMLILSYTPTWLRESPHGGTKPESGLTNSFLQQADFEERMLLGMGGYS